ncbi:MAG TPA: hypothetical protein VF837_05650 [Patescibacteria group bacterium]
MKKTLTVLSVIMFFLVVTLASIMVYTTLEMLTPSHDMGTKLSPGGSSGSTLTLSSESAINATSLSDEEPSWLIDQSGTKFLETTELMPGKFMTKGVLPSGTYTIEGVPASYLFTSESNISLTFDPSPRIKIMMLVLSGVVVVCCLWLVVTLLKMVFGRSK